MDADCHIAGGVDRCTDHRATGAGLGYSTTGIIAKHFDYRAAFWLAAALILVARIVPHKPNRTSRPLDTSGAVLLSALLLCLLLGVSQGHGWGWMSASIVWLFLGFAILLAIWISHELRVEHPLVDLRLMTNRSVLTADIVAFLMGISLYANSSLVNRFVQAPAEVGYGFQAGLFATGVMLMPLSIGSLAANCVSAVLSNRMNAGTLIAVGSLLVGADMAFLALSRSSRWEIFVSVGILGLGIGIAFAAMPAMIVGVVPVNETGSATSMNSVLRSIGGAVGSAASITLLSSYTPIGAQLPTNTGYTVTFFVGSAICVAEAGISLALFPKHPSIEVSAEPTGASVAIRSTRTT